jgi:hypothetical protein
MYADGGNQKGLENNPVKLFHGKLQKYFACHAGITEQWR